MWCHCCPAPSREVKQKVPDELAKTPTRRDGASHLGNRLTSGLPLYKRRVCLQSRSKKKWPWKFQSQIQRYSQSLTSRVVFFVFSMKRTERCPGLLRHPARCAVALPMLNGTLPKKVCGFFQNMLSSVIEASHKPRLFNYLRQDEPLTFFAFTGMAPRGEPEDRKTVQDAGFCAGVGEWHDYSPAPLRQNSSSALHKA